jgi:UDP-glucose 4-epimerase
MNFLITGAYGYLGSQCADFFLRQGHHVRILSRRIPPEMKQWGEKFDNFHADITDPDQLKGSCDNIDVVIHFAAINEIVCAKNTKESILINGLGTKNLLDEAASQNVDKFVYISTFHVYGATKSKIISEETCPYPIHNYGISHYLAELYCHQVKVNSNLTPIILRLSNGYGAPLFPSIDRWSLVMNAFCKEAVEDKKITLMTKGIQIRDFVTINDIIQAISIVVKLPSSNLENTIFNVGGENALSIVEITQIIASEYKDLYGEEIKVQFAPNLKEVTHNIDFTFSIEKIKSLGYSPKGNIHEEIRKTLQFCMTNWGENR